MSQRPRSSELDSTNGSVRPRPSSRSRTDRRHAASRVLSLGPREIVIDRTCVRCRCEYEWGVHIAFFGERAGFTREQVISLTHGEARFSDFAVDVPS